FDPIKREILRLETLPSAETAYATVRKQAAHQNILGATSNESQGIATGLIDIRTGQIIRRGTKKHGLYYVDEVTQSESSVTPSEVKSDGVTVKCDDVNIADKEN
nr:ribonuclease H-like domain-containing protein [Tanacetum cinerariifolium]